MQSTILKSLRKACKRVLTGRAGLHQRCSNRHFHLQNTAFCRFFCGRPGNSEGVHYQTRPIAPSVPRPAAASRPKSPAAPSRALGPGRLFRVAGSVGDQVTVKGIFEAMGEYTTATGLKKSVPMFTAEMIKKRLRKSVFFSVETASGVHNNCKGKNPGTVRILDARMCMLAFYCAVAAERPCLDEAMTFFQDPGRNKNPQPYMVESYYPQTGSL